MQEYVIAVGIDYSDTSIAALDLALEQAKHRTPALLIPVLVLAPANPVELMKPDGDFVRNAKGNLVQLVESRRKRIADFKEDELAVEPTVRFGEAARHLLDLAAELRADLLVVGTHGRQGIGRVVLGSVAGAVIQGAGCPVLIARPESARPEGATAPEANAPQAADEEVQQEVHQSAIVSEPHLADGAVVLYVVDGESGRTFICSYRERDSVTVESLEREWVAASSALERARAFQAAERYIQAHLGRFEELLDELQRRRLAAESEQSMMN